MFQLTILLIQSLVLYINSPIIQRMFQFFSSFGASTNFQKYRLEITDKTYDAPNQNSIRHIISTFSGQDSETKSQIAYATIIKKLLTSDSKYHWIYLMKNLIILDRITEELQFNEQIATVNIPTIQYFKETDQRYLMLDSQRMIKHYWKLIKEKSVIMSKNKHIFCFKRSQRMEYLAKLSAHDTLNEIQSIEMFFTLIFQLVDILSGKRLVDQFPSQKDKILKGREQFNKSKLLEYLYLHLLHKLMLSYSCQLLCNNYFLQIFSKRSNDLTQQDIRSYKRHIAKFKQNSNSYIKFVEERKSIKGFQELNYKQLNPFQNEDIIKLLDQILVQKRVQTQKHPQLEYLFAADEMKVQKKPCSDLKKNTNFIPRISPSKRQSLQMNQTELNYEMTPFSNYANNYSSQFPQKQIMTVDLIIQMKEQDQQQIQESVIQESTKDLCNYSNRDTNISLDFQLAFSSYKHSSQSVAFTNIFSCLTAHWNSC